MSAFDPRLAAKANWVSRRIRFRYFQPDRSLSRIVRPTFIVATDNRLVLSLIVARFYEVEIFTRLPTGAELDSISGSFAYYGNRLRCTLPSPLLRRTAGRGHSHYMH